MKLIIHRDQSQKAFGGAKFVLNVRAELTEEESKLVKKYKAQKEVLLSKEVKIPLTGKSITLDINIDTLINGQSIKCDDIATILETEENIKQSCEQFKNYIEVMRHFGGEEVLEY